MKKMFGNTNNATKEYMWDIIVIQATIVLVNNCEIVGAIMRQSY